MSTKSGAPRLSLQIGPHRRTITITTAAKIASLLRRSNRRTPTGYPPGVLAMIVSSDRWHHHHAWAEDDRNLATQAADIITQILTDIERRQYIATQPRMPPG